jgi:hypothetical protein
MSYSYWWVVIRDGGMILFSICALIGLRCVELFDDSYDYSTTSAWDDHLTLNIIRKAYALIQRWRLRRYGKPRCIIRRVSLLKDSTTLFKLNVLHVNIRDINLREDCNNFVSYYIDKINALRIKPDTSAIISQSRGNKRTSVLLVLLCTSLYFSYFLVLLGTSPYFLVLPRTSSYFFVLPRTSTYFCGLPRTSISY